MTLLSRLLLLVFVALLPALGVQVYGEVEARRARERQVHEEALRLVRMLAAEHRNVAEGARQLLTALGKAPTVRGGGREACSAYSAELLREFPRYASITAADLDGNAVCTAHPAGPGQNVADRAWFRDALRTNDFVVGEYIVGRNSGRPSLTFAQPWRDADGRVMGAIAAQLDLGWLAEQLASLPLPPGAAAGIFDRNGIVLARRPAIDGLVGQPVLPYLRALMERTGEGTQNGLGFDGGRRVFGYSWLTEDRRSLFLVVGLDASLAYAEVNRADRLGIALIAVAALLALLLTALGMQRLVRRPVAFLLRAAESWRRGDLSARVGPALARDDRSEFGRLGAAFDAMAGALQAREAALGESEGRLREFIERAPAAIVMFDTEMRHLATSQRFLTDLGFKGGTDPAAVAGRCHYELFPEVPERWREVHRRVLAGETLSAEQDPFPREDGRLDYMRWHMTPWRQANGSVRGAFLFAELVTERVRLERILAESEARFRAMADQAPTMVWATDAEGACTYLSRPWCEFTGQTEAEGLGSGWLDVIHPEDRDLVRAAFLDAHARHASYSVECRLRRAAGGWAWVIDAAAPRLGPVGEYLGYIGSAVDITGRKKAEEVLARSNEELERLVAQRTAELRESEARLAQASKMEALGRLAGGVAHDFNNVLQAVQGGVALAERRLERDPAAARGYLDLAKDAAARGASVTGRLLSFARRGELSVEPVEARPVLDGLAAMLRPTLGPSIDLAVDGQADVPPFLADAGQLEAVLVNLANNARDALPGGKGRIALSATLPAEVPRQLCPGRYVRVAVADDGHGMTPEVLARVAEPFFTTKPKGRGTGLGLAMARGFAEQSGGTLTIESAPGRGTTVSLWLPEADRRGIPGTGVVEAFANENEAAPSSRVSVLLVDDEPGVRAVLAGCLGEHGHEVAEAEDASGALALLWNGARPDVLVTDLAMPGTMDGLALIREARGLRPGLPAILVTGHVGEADDGALEEGRRSGPLRRAPQAGLARTRRATACGAAGWRERARQVG